MTCKMSKDEIEFMAKAIDGVVRPYGVKKMEVRMKSASYGEKASKIISTRYHGQILNIGGWKEFDVKFGSKSEMEEALVDINAAIVDWRNKWISENQEEYVEHGLPDLTPSPDDPDSPDDKKTKIGDWSTYIIIGAAVAIIALLLWDSKRR